MTQKLRSTLTLLVVTPLLLWSMAGMDVTPARITSGFPKAATMLSDMFAHPDWEYWPIVQQRLIESLQSSGHLTGADLLEAMIWDLTDQAGTDSFPDDVSGIVLDLLD